MQHANVLLLLCCIAQRPDIEAETRVVARGQRCRRADLMLYMRLASAQVCECVIVVARVHVVTQIHVVR